MAVIPHTLEVEEGKGLSPSTELYHVPTENQGSPPDLMLDFTSS